MSSIRWAFNTRLWVNSAENWKMCLSSIQKEEVERLSEFVFQNSAVSSMIGRLLLRRWASKCLSLSWTDVQFGRTDKGRPYLVWPQCYKHSRDVDGNVSHQGDWVVFASCGDGAKIGVDVMKVEYAGGKSVPEFFRLMKRQFTAQEWSVIMSGHNDMTQLASFYRHWCLKEAVVKALGIGIGYDLQRISFQVASETLSEATVTRDTTVEIDGVPDNRWCFEECKLDDQHSAAVACIPASGKREDSSLVTLSAVSNLVQSSNLSSNEDGVGATQAADCSMGVDKCCGFELLSLDEILSDLGELSPITDELVQLFMKKERAAWL